MTESKIAGYILCGALQLAWVVVPMMGAWIAWKWWDRIGTKVFLMWIVVRTVAVFLLLELTTCDSYDLHGWFLHAGWINQGYCPGVDFLTPYSMGFEWLNACAVSIFNSPYSIMILFVLAEVLAVMFIFHPLSSVFNKRTAKQTLILFETSPILLRNSLATQDETLLFLGVACVFGACARGRLALQSAVALATLWFTKILAPFYFFAMFFKNQVKGVVALVLVGLVYVVGAILLGSDPFCLQFGRTLGIDVNADKILSGLGLEPGTLWYYLPNVPSWTWQVPLLVSLFITSILYFRSVVIGGELKAAISLTTMFCLLFQLFYPRFYGCYWLPSLPFLIVICADEFSKKGRMGVKTGMAFMILWSIVQGWPSLPVSALKPYRIVFWSLYAVAHLTVVALVLYRSAEYLAWPFRLIDFVHKKHDNT